MAKTRGISTFAVAATYVGTVVGAGFATGQEVLRFFTHLGLYGVYGVIGAAILFAVLGSYILRLGWELQADSHRPIVEAVTGPTIGRLTDGVITFFLFGGAAVMMAGSGAIFAEHWNLSRFLGTALMALVSGGTVLLGVRGVIASISAVAPVLVALVVIVSLGSITTLGLSPSDFQWRLPQAAASPWWVVSLFLYVSYNLLVSVAVLGPLGKEAEDPRQVHWGGVAGGLTLGLGILLIDLALLAGLPETAGYEVPMLYLAGLFSPMVKLLFTLVLWAEVYTTAVASLFGLSVRLARTDTPRFRSIVVAATLGALVASQIGFSQMVGFLFPAVGWIGLLFVFGLLFRIVRPLVRAGE